jgi:hypothetical protein
MAHKLESIDVSAVPELARIVDEVTASGKPRLLTRDDEEVAVLMPLTRRRKRPKSKAAYAEFRSAAGGWKDVDTDRLIADIYAERRRSNRLPVEL